MNKQQLSTTIITTNFLTLIPDRLLVDNAPHRRHFKDTRRWRNRHIITSPSSSSSPARAPSSSSSSSSSSLWKKGWSNKDIKEMMKMREREIWDRKSDDLFISVSSLDFSFHSKFFLAPCLWPPRGQTGIGREEGRGSCWSDTVFRITLSVLSFNSKKKSSPTKLKSPPTKPKSSPTKPKSPPTKPKSSPTRPKSFPTKPKSSPTKPKSSPTKPKSSPTKPKSSPTKYNHPPETPPPPQTPRLPPTMQFCLFFLHRIAINPLGNGCLFRWFVCRH